MKVASRAAASALILLGASALAEPVSGKFLPLMAFEGRLMSARVLDGGLHHGRYVGVQSVNQSTGRGESGVNDLAYVTFYDCNQPPRMSIVAIATNKEPNAGKPPKWEWMRLEGTGDEFKPESLAYESIAAHEQGLQADLNAKSLGGRKVPGSFQTQATFGCEASRAPAMEEEIARRIYRTADVQGA